MKATMYIADSKRLTHAGARKMMATAIDEAHKAKVAISCCVTDAGGHIVVLERGRIVEALGAPRIDVRCAFGFRASPEIWAKFLSPDPEPLYHDFFAMLMRVPGFTLEGDTLVAMQHARALHRAMNVMRTLGQ